VDLQYDMTKSIIDANFRYHALMFSNLLLTIRLHVFTCFVDFTKAFDNVNYWKLFHKLLDDGTDVYLVRLFAFWYILVIKRHV